MVTNGEGGKQSLSPYGFQFLPARAMFAAAQVARYGAEKYGETVQERNYTKIPADDHINHCIQHLYAYLAGDTSDDHLGHAMVRCMFAYETDMAGKEKKHENIQDSRSGSIASQTGIRSLIGRRAARHR